MFGGAQKRPNIDIEDMTDLYVASLGYDAATIDGQVLNAGYENHTVMQIAEQVRERVGANVEIVATPTDDNRSYHVSSKGIADRLGFVPRRTIADAVDGLVAAFRGGLVPNPMTDDVYYNVRRMQAVRLA